MIRFLAKRRFNYVDGLSGALCALALTANDWWLAGGACVIGAILSVFVEARAARAKGGPDEA